MPEIEAYLPHLNNLQRSFKTPLSTRNSVLATLASIYGQCSFIIGPVHCCNITQPARSTAASSLLGVVIQDVVVPAPPSQTLIIIVEGNNYLVDLRVLIRLSTLTNELCLSTSQLQAEYSFSAP